MGLTVLALLATPACPSDDETVETLTLSITSEAPAAGGKLEEIRVLLSDGTVRFPVDPTDPRFNIALGGFLDPTSSPVIVPVQYGGQTFSSGVVTVVATGWIQGKVVTVFEGSVDLGAAELVSIRLTTIPDGCDTDGDGFLDCAQAGCCPAGSTGLSDCVPDNPAANPWAIEEACESCDDTIDNDCDGQDVVCVDADSDGIADCAEAACGAGDPAVGPGLDELCDGKDNDCDGVTDEGFFLLGTTSSVGDDCGSGACAGGFVQCAGGVAVCSTAGQAAADEDCTNDIDDDCDGVVNDGCGIGAVDEDVDGDGVDDPADCNDLDASIFPGAPEPCCPPALVGTAQEPVCDKNCDGAVSACAADDLDFDGVSPPNDCDDNDPLVYPGAIERCGDGIDQDCVAGDLDCAGVTDADGDGWPASYDCDDSKPGVSPGATETCNGVDDDCDGQTDEGNPGGGAACGSDEGECTFGTVACVNAPSSEFRGQLACVDRRLPAPDLCDGLDNDCDGETDEDFAAGGTVTLTDLDGTTGLTLGEGCGVGACGGGMVVCAPGGAGLKCTSAGSATSETCDAADNDCDGDTDEDFGAAGSVTFTDRDGAGGLILGDACGAGACSGGAVVCAADRTTLACDTSGNAGQDVCDGADNDCDGKIDEDYVAGGAVKFTDRDGTAGLVKGDGCGVGACAGGTVVCGADASSLTCDSGPSAAKDICDGVDNDCDGATDEDYVAGGAVTYTDQNGTAGLVKGAACGVGACAGGSVVCAADKASLTCNTASNASQDVCDGADNDCDGAVDEAYIAGGSVKLTDLDGTAGLVKGDGCGVGACLGGTVECAPDGSTLRCTSHPASSADVCDGTDNDCDGDVDEAYVSGGTVTYTDRNGAAGKVKGDACGVGECAGGTVVCAGDASSLTCSTLGVVSADVCDGLDNDCDGAADEDYIAGGTVTLTDLNGTAALVKGDGCGVGACLGGTVACGADKASLVCTTHTAASADLCDGTDNDCDGGVDEDYVAGGTVTYTDLDGTAAKVKGDGCGVGACTGGTVVCAPDQSSLTCDSAGNASADICDGADNDCDGAADEDYIVGGSVTYTDLDGTGSLVKGDGCGVGACAGGNVVCGADKSSLTCSTVGSASQDICDGADNDCDGAADEDYIAGGSVKYTDRDGTGSLVKGDGCGVGACAGGSVVCGADKSSLTCSTVGSASQDVCDGADNDCDGAADEDYIAGGSVTYTAPDGTANLVKGDGCGVGACTGGSVVCGADKSSLTCSTVGSASQDVCDGADNDCDGAVDEDYIVGGSVTYTDLNGTASLVKGDGCGVGACSGGTVVCAADQASLACSSASNASQDVCDGADNDCDGAVDEDYIVGGSITFTDADGTAGKVKGDLCGTGVCQGGSVVCGPGGVTLVCSTGNNAVPDICDGFDNDCNGTVDDAFIAGGSVTLGMPDGATGLVKGDSCGVGACSGGQVVCAAGGDALRCSSAGSIAPDICDGADNDCDGTTDEAFIVGGSITYADPSGPTGLVKGAPCGAGACTGGMVVCAAGGDALTCNTAGNASAEVCDNADNDCDGANDEDFLPGGTITYTDLDGTVGLAKGAGCGVGACNGGSVVCAGGGLTCSTAASAGPDVCDGADNDCDGVADEAYLPGGTVTMADLNGTAGLAKGQPCGVGDCAGGTVVCGTPTTLSCSSHGAVAPETCDDADNDCDGTVDETFGAGGTTTYDDLGGATGLVKGESCGVGACAGGSVVCGTPTTLTCTTLGNVAADTCDELDNDCDGSTDEAYFDGSVTYTAPDGSGGMVKGADCGTGVCSGGTVVCAPSGTTLTCSTDGNIDADVCDDADNDCDGTTDEAYFDGSVTYTAPDGTSGLVKDAACGVGVCAGGVVVCAPGGTTLTCTTAGNVALDTCDDADNDCDGSTDEDYLAGGTVDYDDLDGTTGLTKGDACGVGACAGGQVICAASGSALTCTTATVAGADICDDVDNDCDGTTDEAFVAGGTVDFDDLNGTTGLVKGDNCGVGACAGGKVICAAGGAALACTSHAAVSADVCDYVDNDCDGATDADYVSGGTTKYADLDGTTGLVRDDACGVGSCAGGVVICGPGGGSLTCTTLGAVSADLCDGVDNDCDGNADTAYGAGGTVTYNDLEGTTGLVKGDGCGVGDCNGGSVVCAPSGTALTCTTLVNVGAETCDNADNDCDGTKDESLSLDSSDLQGLAAAGCLVAGVCGGAGVTTATCGSGAWACVYGGTDYEAGEETKCDGKDNDCDGNVDEPFLPGGGSPYSDNGDNKFKGEGCGTGACVGGTVVCHSSEASLTCSTLSSAGLEECDGLDNDCDAATDEGIVGDDCLSQGVCADGLAGPPVCEGALGWDCDYTNGDFQADDELGFALCDELDNDCDNTSDEDCGDCQIGATQDGICAGCTADTDCASSGWTCMTGPPRFCALNCVDTPQCEAAHGVGWECTPDSVCQFACVIESNCTDEWTGFSCSGGYCSP